MLGDIHGDPQGDPQGGTPPLDRYIQYFNAFETYPRRALTWLNKAKNFETAIIPLAIPTYNLDRGILLKDLNYVALALEGFNPVWQRDMIAICYREFALRERTRPARQAAAEELFSMNRGALLQAGIKLPVEIRFSGDSIPNQRRIERNIRRTLSRTGFTPITSGSTRFILNINLVITPTGNYAAVCELYDTYGTARTIRRTLPIGALSRNDINNFAEILSRTVFRVE